VCERYLVRGLYFITLDNLVALSGRDNKGRDQTMHTRYRQERYVFRQ